MMKKVYIYGLILIFFASTTALPLTNHLCKMMNSNEDTECLMHNVPVKKMMHDCCNEGNDAKVVFTNLLSNCCEIQIVDNKITDEFLNVDKDVFKENSFKVILLNVDNLFNEISPSSSSYFNIHNTSPPSPEEDLYIHNSTLII